MSTDIGGTLVRSIHCVNFFEKIEPHLFTIIDTMKNIHNLITDAFDAIGVFGYTEAQYTVKIRTLENSYKVTIESRNPNAIGKASLTLNLDLNDRLLEFYDTNTLFSNEAWAEFCYILEDEIYVSPNQVPQNTWADYLNTYL
jgi:hypothetical protein